MTNLHIVCGLHSVAQLLHYQINNIKLIYKEKNKKNYKLDIDTLLKRNPFIPIKLCLRSELDQLTQNAKHQGIAAQLKHPVHLDFDLLSCLKQKKQNLFLILDGLQDPHNLGACLRTAEAAQVTAVIAPTDRAVGLTPIVRKIASGAAERIPFLAVTNLAQTLKVLKHHNVWIYGLDEQAETSLYDYSLTGSIAIVMGAEGKGLRRLTREHCDFLIRIPMQGQISSLNVSVATGICLYEIVRQKIKNSSF